MTRLPEPYRCVSAMATLTTVQRRLSIVQSVPHAVQWRCCALSEWESFRAQFADKSHDMHSQWPAGNNAVNPDRLGAYSGSTAHCTGAFPFGFSPVPGRCSSEPALRSSASFRSAPASKDACSSRGDAFAHAHNTRESPRTANDIHYT